MWLNVTRHSLHPSSFLMWHMRITCVPEVTFSCNRPFFSDLVINESKSTWECSPLLFCQRILAAAAAGVQRRQPTCCSDSNEALRTFPPGFHLSTRICNVCDVFWLRLTRMMMMMQRLHRTCEPCDEHMMWRQQQFADKTNVRGLPVIVSGCYSCCRFCSPTSCCASLFIFTSLHYIYFTVCWFVFEVVYFNCYVNIKVFLKCSYHCQVCTFYWHGE